MRALFFALAVFGCVQAQAATVFKCVDSNGKVTFVTNQNCPANHDMAGAVESKNAAPGGDTPTQMAAPIDRSADKRDGQSYSVVGIKSEPPAAPEKKEVKSAYEMPNPRPVNSGGACVKFVERLARTNHGTQYVKVAVPCIN